MPIVARQPGSGPTAGRRSGDEPSSGRIAPPEDLLPLGGASVSAPALAPHRALALDAFLVLRTLRDRPRDAGFWGEPAFAREVDLVRAHLAPIRSRRALALSFAREAFQWPGISRAIDPAAVRPVRVAYAVRWLELGDAQQRAAWSQLVTDRA
jgi:hypothetical protein